MESDSIQTLICVGLVMSTELPLWRGTYGILLEQRRQSRVLLHIFWQDGEGDAASEVSDLKVDERDRIHTYPSTVRTPISYILLNGSWSDSSESGVSSRLGSGGMKDREMPLSPPAPMTWARYSLQPQLLLPCLPSRLLWSRLTSNAVRGFTTPSRTG